MTTESEAINFFVEHEKKQIHTKEGFRGVQLTEANRGLFRSNLRSLLRTYYAQRLGSPSYYRWIFYIVDSPHDDGFDGTELTVEWRRGGEGVEYMCIVSKAKPSKESGLR